MRVLIMILVTQFTLMSLGVKEVGLKIKVRSMILALLHTLSQSCSPMFMLMFSNIDAHAPPKSPRSSGLARSSSCVMAFLTLVIEITPGYSRRRTPNICGPTAKPTAVVSRLHK